MLNYLKIKSKLSKLHGCHTRSFYYSLEVFIIKKNTSGPITLLWGTIKIKIFFI